MHWFYLGIAIVAEVIATSALKSAEGFSRLVPSLVVIGGYSLAFFFLSLSLRVVPVGIAYAIWSGIGVVIVGLVAWLVYGQALDVPAIAGMAMILGGVLVINLFSRTAMH